MLSYDHFDYVTFSLFFLIHLIMITTTLPFSKMIIRFICLFGCIGRGATMLSFFCGLIVGGLGLGLARVVGCLLFALACLGLGNLGIDL